MTDWKALEEAEDHAYFMAELMDISPESFTLEEKKQILHELRGETVATEVNKILAKYQDAFRFMKQDKFVEGTKAVAIDTPTLGNVLTLDADAVIETISALSGISI